MSQGFENIGRIDPAVNADAVAGRVIYAPVKSLATHFQQRTLSFGPMVCVACRRNWQKP